MPLTMGVIAMLLFLFMSGLYLDITNPSDRLPPVLVRLRPPVARRRTGTWGGGSVERMEVTSRSPRRVTKQITSARWPSAATRRSPVQSMTITKTADVEGTLQQIYALAAAGCDIVRCTCNETEAAEGLAQIVPRSPVPIIADIHHQYRMALAALEAGVHGLRLNPGNIRRPEHIKAVATEARDRGVPIRIGVNAGSLDPGALREVRRRPTPEAMVESAHAARSPTSTRSASTTSRSR